MKTLETLFWLVGTLLVLLYVVVLSWTEIERRNGVHDFAMARKAAQQQEASQNDAGVARAVVQADTGPARASPPVAVARTAPADAAVAVLRIPGIRLEVPVSPGTEEPVLQRGAGWIDGTSPPGSEGNIGIAAHRDGHFRGLKDVAVGDLIELDTLQGTRSYRVTGLSVVEPTDVHVLAETGEAVLTLVTCFPFYFVGHAPQRFIVRAAATGS